MTHSARPPFLLLLLVALLAAPAAAAPRFVSLPAHADLTYEPVSLPGDETMGLVGAGLLARSLEDWYLGVAAYGAAHGERGGFFTGGLAVAWRPPVGARLRLDAGLFAGGGGGGSAPQGGGLMLRSHAGLALPTEAGAFGLGWSRVDFPNGDIASSHVAVSFTRPLDLFVRSGWQGRDPVDLERALPGRHHRPHTQRFDAVLIRTAPRTGTLGVDGLGHDASFALTGISWENALGDGAFLDLGLAGAVGGGADGYAQITADLGYRQILRPGTAIVVAGGPGLGGGGRVDTGGGLLGRALAGLEQEVGGGFHLGAAVGLTVAPDGDHRSTDLHLALGRTYRVPVATGGWRVPGSGYYLPRDLRLRAFQQWEWPAEGALRKDGGPDAGLGLGGLALDVNVRRHLYLSGQALAAHSGGAGGYAVGLVGAGVRRDLGRQLTLDLEMLGGAAGGGGIDVDNGIVVQATAGAGVRLSDLVRLRLAYGRSGPLGRGLDRDVLRLGLEFRYSTLSR